LIAAMEIDAFIEFAVARERSIAHSNNFHMGIFVDTGVATLSNYSVTGDADS